MRKILIILTLMIGLCSCGNTNKEYCSACDSELCDIYAQLSHEYSLREFAHQKYISGGDESWRYQYYKIDAEIERLEKDQKYYELEIKKYSKKWEFSRMTQWAYERLDSVKTAIYSGGDCEGVETPYPKVH